MTTRCPECGGELRLRVVTLMTWDAEEFMLYGIGCNGLLGLQYGGYTETETSNHERHTLECQGCGWRRKVVDATPIQRLLEDQYHVKA